ncbi:hypothetical protein JG687_00009997 [Phytophthora cactorum]|uniref:Uncharacterized protein n=1 Tax=Phytophthora cactorum TaxID=29920 RepID=A0A8T1UAQ0_9STRA|nr:hypothetical protein JG687_00009997 [Phytophthora cactorum]
MTPFIDEPQVSKRLRASYKQAEKRRQWKYALCTVYRIGTLSLFEFHHQHAYQLLLKMHWNRLLPITRLHSYLMSAARTKLPTTLG